MNIPKGLALSAAKPEFRSIYFILTMSLMESMSESEFKSYVVRKAKEYIFGTTDSLKEPVINEGVENDVTLESIKEMVAHLKKVNSSLSFNEPSIEEVLSESEERRNLNIGSYETGIELKETLSETMGNYNRQKSLSHGKESQKEAWNRLVDYTKYKEEGK